MSELITFIDPTTPADPQSLGGKGAGLAYLASLGVRIPPAFVLTAEAFRRAIGTELQRQLSNQIATIDPSLSPHGLQEQTAELRRMMMAGTVQHPLRDELRAAYAELASRAGVPEAAVAVRSSSMAEDSAAKSFAGEHDTYLWVSGPDEVDLRVRECWASLFTARAVSYRAHHAVEPADDSWMAMAVVVQQMAPARAAGVLMTLNPVNGDRSKVMIEAVWGLGEPLVSGDASPDRFLVDKVTGELLKREIVKKPTAAVRGEQGVVMVQVADDRRTQPCLSDAEIAELVRVARLIEQRAGRPQDAEFAVVEGSAPENVLLLQCRPETVWSARPRKPTAPGSSALNAVLATLTQSARSKTPAAD